MFIVEKILEVSAMRNNIFDINSFNIIQDDENYYFFRALNLNDSKDINDGIILDENGKIKTILTDREHYFGTPMYDENSSLSLEEVFDHIKMRHRKDTNCISLTSNANTAAIYGRGNYNDQYILVKVPKLELGKNIVQAGPYIINEISQSIEDYIAATNIDQMTKYYLDCVSYANNEEDLERIKSMINGNEDNNSDSIFNGGIVYETTFTDTRNYPGINKVQNFEKNKLLAKMDIIKKKIIPNVDNKFLIQTLGNAFSSMELIHYGKIEQDEILEINKEIIDIFSLIQQLPANNEIVSNLKKDFLSKIYDFDMNFDEFIYNDYKVIDNGYSLETMYELTSGQIDYSQAINAYKKSFYLAKSKLRTDNAINNLTKIYGEDSEYVKLLKEYSKNLYCIEPEIFTRSAKDNINISESAGLDFTKSEMELFNFINNLSRQELESIVLDPKQALSELFKDSSIVNSMYMDKETYYANAIIDMFDWNRLNIKSISERQKQEIIDKLKQNNCVEVYNDLKSHGIKEEYIPNVLLTKVIKDIDEIAIDLTQGFSVDELEDFLGYYEVKDTKIRLRSYQAAAVKNIEETFKDRQFTSVILPTGAGKSFVALTEMEQFKDKRILYLAPNDEILNQLGNHIVKNIHGTKYTIGKKREEIIKESFPNLEIQTYAYLTDNHADIRDKKYDLIIWDELHRTGAKEWGKNIQKLLEHQDENTRILSVTATPERDADNRNMADEWAEYFGYTLEEIAKHKHLSINMNLEEGIRQGFVMHPKIVNCEYNLQSGELDNLLEVLQFYPDSEKKMRIISKFDELRDRVAKADKVDKILKDNIKKGGKYIVFLPVTNKKGENIEDENGCQLDSRTTGKSLIEEYQQTLIKDLSGYIESDEIEFHSMLGAYSKSKNEKELSQFENDSSDKTKFMLVINKLNEGKHVDGVNGMIWYRPLDENSRILYLQQLGRIVYGINPNKELEDEERTIAIDLVNNTYRVNIDRKKREIPSDIDKLNVVVDWINLHGGQLPDINSTNRQEARYASTLKRIQKQYNKFIENISLIENELNKDEIEEILSMGTSIDLWHSELPERIKEDKNGILEENFEVFSVTGILRDLYDLKDEIEKISLSFNEKLGEILEKIPDRNSKERFSDGSAEKYVWLYTHRYEIVNEANRNNELAKQIVIKMNWKDKLSFDEKLEELLLANLDSKSKEMFSDGSAQKYNWRNQHKSKIISEAQNGNELAKQVVEQTKWTIEKNSLLSYDEKLSEILTSDIDSKSKEMFSDDSGQKYNWVVKRKTKILEKAKSGSELDKLVAEKMNWLEDKYDKHDIYLQEILDHYDDYKTKLRFSDDSADMYYWLYRNKEKILKQARRGSELDKSVAEKMNWKVEIDKLSFNDKLLELLSENFDRNSQTKFSDGSAKKYNWLYEHKNKILSEAKSGNSLAKQVAVQRDWIDENTNEIKTGRRKPIEVKNIQDFSSDDKIQRK